jgi:hypothetical protein
MKNTLFAMMMKDLITTIIRKTQIPEIIRAVLSISRSTALLS